MLGVSEPQTWLPVLALLLVADDSGQRWLNVAEPQLLLRNVREAFLSPRVLQ